MGDVDEGRLEGGRLRLEYPASTATAKGRGPLLMCFRGAPPSEKLELKVLRKPGPNDSERMRVRAAGERVSYAGAQRPTHGECFLVGVRKKGSDRMRLLRLAGPFVMDAAEPDPQFFQPAVVAAPEAVGAQPMGGREGKESLVALLGSEKARKRQQRAAQKEVKADAVIDGGSLNEHVRSALADAASADAAALSEQEKRPAHPRFDLEATTARAAYPREALVPDSAWAAIDTARLDADARSAERLAAMEADDVRVWPALVLRVLRTSLPAGPVGVRPAPASSATGTPVRPSRGGERVETLRALTYLTYMCRFASIKRAIAPPSPEEGAAEVAVADHADQHPLARRLAIPPAAWRELLDAFTETQGGAAADDPSATRRLTDRCRQKLHFHVLALALWVGEGKADAAELAKMLLLTPKLANLCLRQLGVVFSKSRGSTACELAVPLQLPRVEQGRAAPKKRG